MSSYLNNLLTTTTSRYNTLRRQLLSDDADGDTEDDTHISRVLRAYYTEKGRPFPQWLPPDPKAPQSAPVQMVSSAGQRGYGNMGAPQQVGRGGAAISDLWDAPSQQQQQQEPMSLRRAQGRGGGRPGMGSSLSPEPQMQGRPLPSQRAGSYQSAGYRPAEPSPPPSAGSGVSAQDRLKARLWGSGRSTSPAQSGTSSGATSPANTPGAPMRSPYERSGGGAPSGGGRQDGGGYKPSSNSPWAGNDDPYGPGYNSGPPPQQQPPGGRRVGLPSGPRMR